jgi:broad specificity phosphatase PhoE
MHPVPTTAHATIYRRMILIRHGQSEFNLHFSATRVDPGIPDPKLTPLGQAQAEAAAETLAGVGITRIIASPYTRAMQTAAPFARRLGLGVTISPLVRERYHFVCDIGSPVSALRAEWPQHDFGDLPETWWPAETETEAEALTRATAFHAAMAAQPDHAETLVVTHWAFIRAMTGLSLGNGEWIVIEPGEPG